MDKAYTDNSRMLLLSLVVYMACLEHLRAAKRKVALQVETATLLVHDLTGVRIKYKHYLDENSFAWFSKSKPHWQARVAH